MLAAVEQEGHAILFASKDLRDDPKIVLAAVKQDGSVIQYVSESMKSDPKIMLAAVVGNDATALHHASKSLKSDPKIVLAAVKRSGEALEYASKSLKSDPKIVLAAVKGNDYCSWTLQFASKDLRDDPKIVLAAVKHNGSALEYASKSMKSDSKIVLAAVKENGLALQFVSKKLRFDPKIVNVAISENPAAIQYADESCTSNQIIVIEDVQSNGTNLDFNSVGFKIGIEKNLGVPVKCSASYGPVCTLEKEDGVFSGVGEESIDVKGYIIWDESTWGDLIWELPKSTEDCIDAIEQGSWVWCDEASESDISFDECTFHENGSGANAGEMAANEDVDISDLDPGDFQCDDSSFIEMSTSSSPETITIEYDSGFKIELKDTRGAKWTGKFNMDSTTVSIGILEYENVFKVVRHCLEDVDLKNTFDSIISKLLELNN